MNGKMVMEAKGLFFCRHKFDYEMVELFINLAQIQKQTNCHTQFVHNFQKAGENLIRDVSKMNKYWVFERDFKFISQQK